MLRYDDSMNTRDGKYRTFHDEIRNFVMRRNPGLRNGLMDGAEITNTYYCRDDVPLEIADSAPPEVSTVTMSVAAYEISSSPDERCFEYSALTSVGRRMTALSEDRLLTVPAKKREKYQDFEDIDVNVFEENLSVQFAANDLDKEELEIAQHYQLTYLGRTVIRQSSEGMLRAAKVRYVDVPALETASDTDVLRVTSRVKQERLPDDERLLADINFRSAIEGLDAEFIGGMTYETAEHAIHMIIRTLRYGYRERP
jgi:hypothetical protein